MDLPHSQLLINQHNDKEVIMSTINNVIIRSSTPTANLNNTLTQLQNKALDIEEQQDFQLHELEVHKKKHQYHIPANKTAKPVFMTQSYKPVNTRLPATISLTPGPQAYTPTAQYNLGMLNSCPGFSLSSRYDKNRDFSRTNGLQVGPGQYNVGREQQDFLSSSKQTKNVKIKACDTTWHTYGPGPGKYLSDTSGLSNGKLVHNLNLNDGRQSSFSNFVSLKETKFKPGVGTYDPKLSYTRPQTPGSLIQPESSAISSKRNFQGIKATKNCPDCYQYDVSKVSRKLVPNNRSSLLEK